MAINRQKSAGTSAPDDRHIPRSPAASRTPLDRPELATYRSSTDAPSRVHDPVPQMAAQFCAHSAAFPGRRRTVPGTALSGPRRNPLSVRTGAFHARSVNSGPACPPAGHRHPRDPRGTSAARNADPVASRTEVFPARLIPGGVAIRMREDGESSGRRYQCGRWPWNGSRRTGCA
jgi:hypothetical protein